MMEYQKYQEMIAELSQEEVESIQQLVNQHYGKTNIPRLQQLVREAHPLCAEQDLHDAMNACISKSKVYQEAVKQEGHRPVGPPMPPSFPSQQRMPPNYPPPPLHQQQMQGKYIPQQKRYQEPYGKMQPPNYPPPNSGIIVFSKDQPISHKVFSTEDPANILASRWTDEETEKLKEYLDMTQGRKDWTKCARYVGTKSNAQCKAKYNNMRASDRARDVFAL
ncbi:hypothetical protein GGI22_002221 [Coemansia erecta]|nr:hypothetical protein GGI22_002221 [Coemansia erecta]